jgi:MspA
MLNRFATLAAVCMLTPVAAAPVALADPPPPDPAVQPVVDPGADPGPPPDTGVVASSDPGIVTTPDGWVLNVAATNESELPIAPLTTALSSREYLVAGTFTGKVTGGGKTKLTGGSLEAGVQIGCGIISDEEEVNPGVSFQPSIGIPLTGANAPLLQAGISLQGKIYLKPGTVNIVPLDKKSFKGKTTRVTITDVRVKFDTCAGQSFIRTYATLTSSTDNTDDVITYLGVTKAV